MAEPCTIIKGDCIEEMAKLDADSIDSIVTDPPYGLEFMGKEWDRLDGIGKASGGLSDPDPGPWGRRERVSFHHAGAGNFKCGNCNRWKWDHEGRRCECGSDAIWPNVYEHRGSMMQEWHYAWAVEALRVLKPGGHLLAFGGTRTYHRLACALENAGFEIRDCVMWVYGSGFPKSLDVSKAIDKAAGAEREVVGTKIGLPGYSMRPDNESRKFGVMHDDAWVSSPEAECAVTAPATEEAKKWDGWGTALKPAWEPIIVARKPLGGTVAENVLKHGTGALNIVRCRIGDDEVSTHSRGQTSAYPKMVGHKTVEESGGKADQRIGIDKTPRQGRWPANVIHDGSEEVVELFPQSSGKGGDSSGTTALGQGSGWNAHNNRMTPIERRNDEGSAARFFYCAKASKQDRDEGLGGLEPKPSYMVENGSKTSGLDGERYERTTMNRNTHPTVKPTALMRWLVKLVTRPGGLVLDPFMGSGSTGKACALEGVAFLGVEREDEYIEIARRRIAHAHEDEVEVRGVEERNEEPVLEKPKRGQLELFEVMKRWR